MPSLLAMRCTTIRGFTGHCSWPKCVGFVGDSSCETFLRRLGKLWLRCKKTNRWRMMRGTDWSKHQLFYCGEFERSWQLTKRSTTTVANSTSSCSKICQVHAQHRRLTKRLRVLQRLPRNQCRTRRRGRSHYRGRCRLAKWEEICQAKNCRKCDEAKFWFILWYSEILNISFVFRSAWQFVYNHICNIVLPV